MICPHCQATVHSTSQPERKSSAPDDVYDPVYDEGITYAIRMLADLTGSKDWQMRDGSEDHETDVRDTIMDVLKCAGLYDDEDGKFAALAATPAVGGQIETSRSKYPPRWEGLYWTRDITQPEAGPGPWEAYEWNGTLWWGIVGARGYSHTEFSEMCEIGPKIEPPRAAQPASTLRVDEKALTDFICETQDRLGPGCDELAIAQAILRIFSVRPASPLRGREITDDMIDRAIEAHVEPFDSGDAVGAMRAALEAALTSTPASPPASLQGREYIRQIAHRHCTCTCRGDPAVLQNHTNLCDEITKAILEYATQ